MQLTYCFRPSSVAKLTIGQTQAAYRAATPREQLAYKDTEPTMCPDRHILVSGQNANIPPEERCLPSHIQLSDGKILLLLRNVPPRVVYTNRHKDTHAQMYSDMFLYLPWQDEEQFLGEASRSFDHCQAMWDEYGAAALDLKQQLNEMIKQSWLSRSDDN